MKYLAPLLAISALAMTSTSPGAQQQKATSVVLVHGAFVDGSGWQAVYDLLKKDGYEVLVVQNPTITLEGDVAATEAVIAAAKHPVVLVGHSYGGMVITQAGENPKVKSLAYIAAFAPDTGESAASLNDWPAEPGETKAPLLPPQNGYLLVDPAKFPTSFAADSPAALTEFMAVAQVPWGLNAVETKVTKVGWKAKPSVFLIPSQDRMITPSSQRKMAKRSGARVEEISSSHAVMLSHPREVAAFIGSADR